MEELVIWGAGAIGGTVGAFLSRGGRNPLLVDADAAHVAAMKRSGLKITGPVAEFTTPVRAATPDEVRGPIRHVMLAVKSQHTSAAARMIAPLLAPDATVLSLQNGLNGDAIAAEVGAERVLLALVDFASDYIEPGVIHYGGRGSVYVGELDGKITPRVQECVAILKHFDERIEASDNVLGIAVGEDRLWRAFDRDRTDQRHDGRRAGRSALAWCDGEDWRGDREGREGDGRRAGRRRWV